MSLLNIVFHTDNHPNSNGEYTGDGPYVGPDETGQSISAPFTMNYKFFGARLVDKVLRSTPLPIVATSGENNVVDGKYIADYTGSLDVDIFLEINRNNSIVDPIDEYSFIAYRNGAVINSNRVQLSNSGINSYNYNIVPVQNFYDEIGF